MSSITITNVPAPVIGEFFCLASDAADALLKRINYSVAYLNSFDFEPHEGGNGYTCGLHTPYYWGPINSNIMIGEDMRVWRFVDFDTTREHAIYVNQDREFIKIPAHHQDPTVVRMQIAHNTSLPTFIVDYLSDLLIDLPIEQLEAPRFAPEPEAPENVREWLDLIGFSVRDLLSVMNPEEPDVDGCGEARCGGYGFDMASLLQEDY